MGSDADDTVESASPTTNRVDSSEWSTVVGIILPEANSKLQTSDMERGEQLLRLLRESQQSSSSYHGLTILITGASSGVGLSAASLLLKLNPLHRIVLACRDQNRANDARMSLLPLLSDESNHENIIALPCDHTSTESIKSFNEVLRTRLDETYSPSKWMYNGIDVLCLNAAILVSSESSTEFTKDGLETTFQTNYVSAFQLAHLTMDLLNPCARIVLATSGLYERETLCLNGTYDPKTGATRTHFEMPDGSQFHFKRSYALSKLCVVALCAELEHRLRGNGKGILVNCFSPGLILTTGLFRNQKRFLDTSDTKLSKEVLALQKTVTWGAGSLLYMALAVETGQRSGEYWRDADSVLGWRSIYGVNFCPVDITRRFDEETRQRLWQSSLHWIGAAQSSD